MKTPFTSTLFLFSLALFFITLHFFYLQKTQWHLPTQFIKKPVRIHGAIDSIPEYKHHGLHFIFLATQFNHQKIHAHLLLSWYGHWGALKPGQQWQLQVKLKSASQMKTFHGFNYARYLWTQGIPATGYVVSPAHQNKYLGQREFRLMNFRASIEREVQHAVGYHSPVAAFISAITVGLRSGFSTQDWQVLQKTGTNHLVAVAGLHIGFVFGIVFAFAQFVLKFFPRLFLHIPARRLSIILGAIIAISYAALSGFAIPAERASIMLCCWILADCFSCPVSSVRRLSIAALVILMIAPMDLWSMSFWLSITSISLLIWVLSGRLGALPHWKTWLKMQGAMTVGLLPLMLLFFQQTSIVAMITNAIAIPWVGFVVLPVSLAGVLIRLCGFYALSTHTFWLAGKLLLPIWLFLQKMSQLSFSSWHHIIVKPDIFMMGLLACFFLLAPRGWPARWLGLLGLLPIFLGHGFL